MKTLFDEKGLLNISDIVSTQIIMEDGIVTDKKLKDQVDATIASLRKLQALCNEEQQNAILEAISEMSVPFAAYHNYELQDLRK